MGFHMAAHRLPGGGDLPEIQPVLVIADALPQKDPLSEAEIVQPEAPFQNLRACLRNGFRPDSPAFGES